MPKAPLKHPPKKGLGVEKPTPDSLLDNLAQGAPENSNPQSSDPLSNSCFPEGFPEAACGTFQRALTMQLKILS